MLKAILFVYSVLDTIVIAMSFVFSQRALQDPTPMLFPVGNSFLPYLLAPHAPSRRTAGVLWTNGIHTPELRNSIMATSRAWSDWLARRVLGFLGHDATVWFFRRPNIAAPFPEVNVGLNIFEEVKSVAIVTLDAPMSSTLLNIFFAYGAPRRGDTLSIILTEFQDAIAGTGYDMLLSQCGQTVLIIPVSYPAPGWPVMPESDGSDDDFANRL